MPSPQRIVESQVKGVAEPAEEASRAARVTESSSASFSGVSSGNAGQDTVMGNVGEAVVYSAIARLTTTGGDSTAVYMAYSARDNSQARIDGTGGAVSNHPVHARPPFRVPSDGDVEIRFFNEDGQTNDGIVSLRYVEVD